MSPTSPPMTLIERARALVAGWEHGDEQHRQWLRDTATPQIEEALRDVRREALEEAAVIADSHASYKSPELIRALAERDGS